MIFNDLVKPKEGFLRGPFGGDLKKDIFVEKGMDTYKVYEQGVVLQRDNSVGRYYISSEYFAQKMKRFAVADGDFLVSCSGMNMGAIFQLKQPFEAGVINQALLRIRLNNDIIDDDYFFYYFSFVLKREIVKDNGNSTIPNFPALEHIKEIQVSIHKLDDQKRISKALKSIDRKIEINNLINAELEKLAKTIYEYWFAQFDFPDAQGKPYKSSGGAMEYNQILKREIPKGWQVKPLTKTDLCSLIATGADSFEGEKIYLSTSEVDNSEIVNHSVLTDFPNRLSRANMQPKLNSVWFAKMKATYKNILIDEGATELIDDYIFSTGFSGLECRDETVHYLWNYLKGDYFERKKNLLATGATQQAINEDDLDSFVILVPPDELLEKFRDAVKASYLHIGRSKRQNLELANLRDFLLPLLMNGQVTVRSLE